jgi:tRNA1(Val) A37 N6-methylase TrmN6
MLTWLLEQADALGLARPGARILELGSGTGWMMLNVACHLPELNVTLSDQAEAVTSLKSNVERATQEHPALAGRVRVPAAVFSQLAARAAADPVPWAPEDAGVACIQRPAEVL